MKRFLTKTFLFILVSIASLCGLYFLGNSIVRKKADFKFDRSVTSIIIGHSHPECAFDDSIIPNFKNCSYSGESYFYGLPKMKNILSQNPQIKTVFIEFTDNHLERKVMNDGIWGESHLLNFYPTYSPFIEAADAELLLQKSDRNFLLASSISIKEQFLKIFSSNYNFRKYGRYLYLERDKTDSLVAQLQRSSANKPKVVIENNNDSNYNIAYLTRIINLCAEKGIKTYLVRSPQHKAYRDQKNEAEFEAARLKLFPDIEFLDFNNYPCMNSEFGDLEHLNYRGARKFSTWVNNLIRDGLLMAANKQDFINSRMPQ